MNIDAETVEAVIEALAESGEHADKFADLLTLRARIELAQTTAMREAAEDAALCALDELVLDLVAELGTRKPVAA